MVVSSLASLCAASLTQDGVTARELTEAGYPDVVKLAMEDAWWAVLDASDLRNDRDWAACGATYVNATTIVNAYAADCLQKYFGMSSPVCYLFELRCPKSRVERAAWAAIVDVNDRLFDLPNIHAWGIHDPKVLPYDADVPTFEGGVKPNFCLNHHKQVGLKRKAEVIIEAKETVFKYLPTALSAMRTKVRILRLLASKDIVRKSEKKCLNNYADVLEKALQAIPNQMESTTPKRGFRGAS